MPDRTILTEAAQALLAADRVDRRTCPDRLIGIFRDDCEDCQREALDLSATVLRAIEGRILARARELQETRRGDTEETWSWRARPLEGMVAAADLIAEGLPEETNHA
jgi:hypothetical protein